MISCKEDNRLEHYVQHDHKLKVLTKDSMTFGNDFLPPKLLLRRIMERADDLLSMLSAYFKALPFITLKGKENNITRSFMDTRMMSNVPPPPKHKI